MSTEPKCRVFVGIDWGGHEHVVCAVGPDGKKLKTRSFPHSGEGLADLVKWLEKLSDGHFKDVKAAIEMPRGAVVETLVERGVEVFSINPKQVDRFRDRYSMGGAKDDPRDAYVLADSLRTDAHCFRRVVVDDPIVIELREWSRIHDELTDEKLACTSRIREQLRRYFPQYLKLSTDLGEDWIHEVWKLIPTPEAVRKVSQAKIKEVLKKYRIRRVTASKVLQTLGEKPIFVASGTSADASAHIEQLSERLKLVNRQLQQCDARIVAINKQLIGEAAEDEEEERKEQRDARVLDSMPGTGKIVLATLLTEAAHSLRYRDYESLRVYCGSAPVTIRSGKKKKKYRVVMRRGCNPRLREACYHWARTAVQRDEALRNMYTRQRQKGNPHGQALRAVADRLLKIACAMLKNGSLYDPQLALHGRKAVPAA